MKFWVSKSHTLLWKRTAPLYLLISVWDITIETSYLIILITSDVHKPCSSPNSSHDYWNYMRHTWVVALRTYCETRAHHCIPITFEAAWASMLNSKDEMKKSYASFKMEWFNLNWNEFISYNTRVDFAGFIKEADWCTCYRVNMDGNPRAVR